MNEWPINEQKMPMKIIKYWHIRDDLHLVEGLILKIEQIFIPSSLQNCILQKLHTSTPEVEKSIAQARKTVHWPGMTSNIKVKILKCNTCLKCRNHNQKQPLVQHEIPDLPWQNIGSDIFKYEGKIYLFVIDYYSKFIASMLLLLFQPLNLSL